MAEDPKALGAGAIAGDGQDVVAAVTAALMSLLQSITLCSVTSRFAYCPAGNRLQLGCFDVFHFQYPLKGITEFKLQ